MKLPRLQVQIGAHAAKLDGKRLCHQGNACCDYRFGGRKAVSLDENLKSAFHQKQTLSDFGQLSLTVSMILGTATPRRRQQLSEHAQYVHSMALCL